LIALYKTNDEKRESHAKPRRRKGKTEKEDEIHRRADFARHTEKIINRAGLRRPRTQRAWRLNF
jgi:hypothetical protein